MPCCIEKFGKYEATLTINSESLENSKVSFMIKLNPLAIEKGYRSYRRQGLTGKSCRTAAGSALFLCTGAQFAERISLS